MAGVKLSIIFLWSKFSSEIKTVPRKLGREQSTGHSLKTDCLSADLLCHLPPGLYSNCMSSAQYCISVSLEYFAASLCAVYSHRFFFLKMGQTFLVLIPTMFKGISWKIVKISKKKFETLDDALFEHTDDLQRWKKGIRIGKNTCQKPVNILDQKLRGECLELDKFRSKLQIFLIFILHYNEFCRKVMF